LFSFEGLEGARQCWDLVLGDASYLLYCQHLNRPSRRTELNNRTFLSVEKFDSHWCWAGLCCFHLLSELQPLCNKTCTRCNRQDVRGASAGQLPHLRSRWNCSTCVNTCMCTFHSECFILPAMGCSLLLQDPQLQPRVVSRRMRSEISAFLCAAALLAWFRNSAASQQCVRCGGSGGRTVLLGCMHATLTSWISMSVLNDCVVIVQPVVC
jgi:hypothetical protein